MAELKLGTTIGGSVAWHEGNDGSGSGLDADYLDGNHASAFALSGHTHSYLPLSGGTITGKVTFPSAIDDRPQLFGGFLSMDTGDADANIWGISRDYYPSHGTAANQWGIAWNADTNQIRFVGSGNTRLSIDLDGGTTGLTWDGNTVWNAGNDGASSGLDADLLDGNHASAFALASHTHSYLSSESDTLATVTGRGSSTSTLCNFNGNITISGGTPTLTYAGYAGIEYWNNSTWQVYIGTESNTAGARQNSRNGVHTWYNNSTQAMQLNANNLTIVGSLSAASKSFLIPHPTKEGWKLRYGSLEGPENGVYIRGKLKGKNKIELPEYWTKLVDPNSITVTLTPIGKHQKLYVEDISNNTVTVANDGLFAGEINCFFVVYGERVDIDKLVVEYE